MDQYINQDILSYLDLDSRVIIKRIDLFWNKIMNNLGIDFAINIDDPFLSSIDKIFLSGCCSGSFRKINDVDIETIRINGMDDSYYQGYNLGLDIACQAGKMDVVQFMINNGATNWNEGLYGACKTMNIDIIKLMIEMGACNWNVALETACYNGNLEIINLLISNGADDWNSGLSYACSGCHIDIVKMMLLRIQQMNDITLYFSLFQVCSKDNKFEERKEIIELLMTYGLTDFNSGLSIACRIGNMEMVKYLIDKGANDWNGGMIEACINNKIDIINLMIEKGANDWDTGVVISCENNNYDIVNLMIEKGAVNFCERCNPE